MFKALLFKYLKSFILEQVYEYIIIPLRKKVKDSESKWDDELLNELERLIQNWIK